MLYSNCCWAEAHSINSPDNIDFCWNCWDMCQYEVHYEDNAFIRAIKFILSVLKLIIRGKSIKEIKMLSRMYEDLWEYIDKLDRNNKDNHFQS